MPDRACWHFPLLSIYPHLDIVWVYASPLSHNMEVATFAKPNLRHPKPRLLLYLFHSRPSNSIIITTP